MAEMVMMVAVAGAFLAFVLYVASRPRIGAPDDRDEDPMGPEGPTDPASAFGTYARFVIGTGDRYRLHHRW